MSPKCVSNNNFFPKELLKNNSVIVYTFNFKYFNHQRGKIILCKSTKGRISHGAKYVFFIIVAILL